MKYGVGAVVGVAVIVFALGGCDRGVAGGDGQAGDVQLGEPEAVYPEPFAVVSTVREFEDGRVLVADPLGQVVVRVDLDAGTADTIGAVGEGPDEYRQPDAVWPLPGGRTLLVDLGNGRLTELSPELRFGETRPYAMVNPEQGTLLMVLPQAVDDLGRLYFPDIGGMGGGADSVGILRIDLETGVVDSLARVKMPDMTRRETGGANNQNVQVSAIPLSPADAWGVSRDGRVAVARSGDYHLDWIEEDGSVTSGSAIPYDPVAIGRAEREEWRDERSEVGGGFGIEQTNINGVITIRATRGGVSDDDDQDDSTWPEVKPAFYSRPVQVDGRGRAWVRRHREAGEATVYDVFDGSGEVEMTVEVGEGRRVVSFGDGKLYAVRMDEYGLQVLERYALP
ncbi:MAG: hypothetical protein F4139_04355 [Gemmatimonadetes bacterium]|nr:hypothetical protein [Gemmatimonadota bacterium]